MSSEKQPQFVCSLVAHIRSEGFEAVRAKRLARLAINNVLVALVVSYLAQSFSVDDTVHLQFQEKELLQLHTIESARKMSNSQRSASARSVRCILEDQATGVH